MNVLFRLAAGGIIWGALLKGRTVQLKDANNVSTPDTTTDAVTGVYSIDVSGQAAISGNRSLSALTTAQLQTIADVLGF